MLDSVCAVLGESIYDSSVYGMKLDNSYLLSQREELADSLAGLLKHRERKCILLRMSSSGEGICHMPK